MMQLTRQRVITALLGAAALAVSFVVSLSIMNYFWPPGVTKPVLAQLPPLPPVSSNSEIMTPIAVSLSAIRDALDRAAPRDLGGKVENPVAQILSKADINWTVTRGPIATLGSQNVLALSTPLDGKLTVLGALSTAGGTALESALGNVLGGNVAKQIGNVSIKNLNANAAIHGTVAMSAQPMGRPGWPEFAFSTASMERKRIALAIRSCCSRDVMVPPGWGFGALGEALKGVRDT